MAEKHYVVTDGWKGVGKILKVSTPPLKYVPWSSYLAFLDPANWKDIEFVAEFNSFNELITLVNLLRMNLTFCTKNMEGTETYYGEFIDRNIAP